MKLALGLAVAVAGLVLSLARPVGAAYPDDGKITIKNMTPVTIGISRSVDPFITSIPPKKSYKLTKVNRFEAVGIDFDYDGDSSVDTTYPLNLAGAKSFNLTIGTFGMISIVNQEE